MFNMEGLEIHETAVVSHSAVFEKNVSIGPYSVVGDGVKIGSGTEVGAYAQIDGPAEIGKNNVFGKGVSIGLPPQSIDHEKKDCSLYIGNGNQVRDFASIHRGPLEDGGTVIGDNNVFQLYSHVAYSCKLSNNIYLDNSVNLANNVEIADDVYCGKLSGIHQYVRLGRLSYVENHTKVSKDVPPFIRVVGHPASVQGLNESDLTEGEKDRLIKLYNLIFKESNNIGQAVSGIREKMCINGVIEEFLTFLKGSNRGICT